MPLPIKFRQRAAHDSPGISGLKENRKLRDKLVADPKSLRAHVGKYPQGIIDKRSLIAVAEDTERTNEGKSAALRDCSSSPFIHDQHIRLLFRCQLNGFPFAAVEGGRQFSIGSGMERVNT